MQKAAAIFSILMGVTMFGTWAFLLLSNQFPAIRTVPLESGYLLVAEFLTAVALIVAGYGVLTHQPWGLALMLVALGELIYCTIRYAGELGQGGSLAGLTFFSLVAAGGLIFAFLSHPPRWLALIILMTKFNRRKVSMVNIFKKQHDMNIVGQGGKIILFTLPALIAAIWVQKYLPQIAALPETMRFIQPLGYVLLLLGLILWGAAVIQLLMGFSNGKLVTTGAYGVVRNPIYSSVTFFILPAVALLTFTWVYFVVSVFLYVGVMIFIGTEEAQLTKAFGMQYVDYLARVDRLIPFKKP